MMKLLIIFILLVVVDSIRVDDILRKRQISLHVPILHEGDAKDVSDFDQDVHLHGTTTALGYRESFGFYFDGTSSMNVPSLIMRPQESIAVTIRVKPSAGAQKKLNVFVSGSCDGEALKITFNSDSKWCLEIGNNEILVGPSVQLGKWIYVGASYDSSTHIATLLVGETTLKTTVLGPDSLKTTSEFSVGSCSSQGYAPFQGTLDSVAVRSVALTIEELIAIGENAIVPEIANSPSPAKFALSVTDSNGYVEIGSDFPDSYLISEPISSLSVQASVRPSVSLRRDSGLYGVVDLNGVFSLLLRQDGETQFRLVVRVNSSPPTNWITPIVLQENEWNVVSFVWTQGRIYAYRFGENPNEEESYSMQVSTTITTNVLLPITTESMLIGAMKDGEKKKVSSYFEGLIDDVRVWKTHLSQDELRFCSRSSSSSSSSEELVGRWTFDEGIGFATQEVTRGTLLLEGVFRQSPSFVVSTSFLDNYVEIADTQDVMLRFSSSSSFYTIRTLPNFGILLDSETNQEIQIVPHNLRNNVVMFRPQQTNVNSVISFRYTVRGNDNDEATMFITVIPTTHPSKVTTSNLKLQFQGYSVEDVDALDGTNALDLALEVTDQDSQDAAVLSIDATYGLNFGGQSGEGDGSEDRRMRFQGSVERTCFFFF